MSSYRGFILDLDGTVYRGERALPGAVEAIAALRGAGRRIVFVSNKPLEPAPVYAAKLTRLGIPTPPGQVLTSAGVLIDLLRRKTPEAELFVIGEPPLLAEFEEGGFRLTEDPARAEVVVAAFDRTFDYAKWTTAFRAIRRGARFVATNADPTCPVEDGEMPDCGGIIAALEASTGRRVELVAGKPSPHMVEAALSRLDLPPEAVLLVGDRLETDVAMGREAGIATALVLTGVTDREALRRSDLRPDHVLENLGEVAVLAG